MRIGLIVLVGSWGGILGRGRRVTRSGVSRLVVGDESRSPDQECNKYKDDFT